MNSPRNIISIAFAAPTILGRRNRPPLPGNTPKVYFGLGDFAYIRHYAQIAGHGHLITAAADSTFHCGNNGFFKKELYAVEGLVFLLELFTDDIIPPEGIP